MRAAALFFGAHPDDVELTSAGLAATLAARGERVVIADLTRGELGTRGDVETRAREAKAAALGAAVRENLALPDGALNRHDRAQPSKAVVECLRRHAPFLVVAPHRMDAHPDHARPAPATRACWPAACALRRGGRASPSGAAAVRALSRRRARSSST